MFLDIKVLSKIMTDINIRPSYQRIGILEYLSSRKTHPTVDEIYNALLKKIPTLSRTTVYNTLNLFLKTGLVCPVTIEDNQARYDIKMHDHGHFQCTSCSTVYDFETDFDNISKSLPEGFKVNEKNIYFKGICSKCFNDTHKK